MNQPVPNYSNCEMGGSLAEHFYARKYQPNQLHREFLSINGLNFADGFDSSSRKQMFASHLGQSLVLKGATVRYIQTGMEREYGKYTFGVRMPENGQILKVIDRHSKAFGYDSIQFNPETTVIYEEYGTNRIGCFTIPRYCSYHQYFGFEFKHIQENLQALRYGANIAKDTVFAQTPSLDEGGNYKYGIQLNACHMTHPAVSEDGVMICRDVLPKLAYKTYETRTVAFGSKRFPVNAYGTLEKFKAFPDIGEYIREDGLLMALRLYNVELAPIDQSLHDLMEIDYYFDQFIYAPPGKGRVVDIIVHHDESSMHPCTPLGMEAQAMKYVRARDEYFESVVKEYDRLRKSRPDGLTLTPRLHQLIKEGIATSGRYKERMAAKNRAAREQTSPAKENIQKLNRQVPMDDYTITFVIEYENIPDVGNKITGCHGDKGVIVYVAEPEEMPVDQWGVRADIVMDPLSSFGRMNPGRNYEHFINAASYDVRANIAKWLGVNIGEKGAEAKIRKVYEQNPTLVNKAFEYLVAYYRAVNPKQAVWFDDGTYQLNPIHHMAKVIEEFLIVYFPPDNDKYGMDIVRDIIANFEPHFGPVTYKGYSGKVVTTKCPIRIASSYFLLLEKTGDDWTAVSSAKVQHFGVLSQVSGVDKYALPTRQSPTRTIGEAEKRIIVAYVGAETAAEQYDRSNNTITHRHICEEILSNPTPTNIERIVDRSKIPFGGAKALRHAKHLLETFGMRFVLKAWEFMKKPFGFGDKK